MKKYILLLLISLIVTPCSIFAFTVSLDSCGQSTDGSKLFDIWYTLEGVNDPVEITILPITSVTNETLLCETFIEPSDTGVIAEDGSYHIIWDVGSDIPGREFCTEKIEIEIIAAKPGIVPGECFNVCGETEVVLVVNPATSESWMDRNLGASRQATAYNDYQAFGALFQWGRLSGGHECIDWVSPDSGVPVNDTTGITSSTNNPGHSLFIVAEEITNFDWLMHRSDTLWQDVDGINNPFPPGYRLPTRIELQNELDSWASDDMYGAYESPLRLVLAGFRNLYDGNLYYTSSFGYYWSCTTFGSRAYCLYINGSSARVRYDGRAFGFCVRCIKD